MSDNDEVPPPPPPPQQQQPPYAFSSPEQHKINLIVSQILSAKYLSPSLINDELIKQIASQIKPSYARSPNESASASTSPSPSLSASSNSSATLFGSSSQTLSNSLSHQSSLSSSIQNVIISSNESHYDFYKDLQAKLNLKNDNDEARTNSPKHSRMHHLNRNGAFKPSQVAADKHLNSSSFETKSGSYLSNPSINNNSSSSSSSSSNTLSFSNPTSKIICRSNSSPSYSSSSSSSPSPNAGQTATQNSLAPYSSSINLGQAQPMVAQSAFIFKSSSCSLPVSSPVAHVEGGGQPFGGAYFANEMSMSRKLLAKPPEIVITESKPDNEQVDYEIEQANFDYQNSQSKKIEYEIFILFFLFCTIYGALVFI